ncbi:CrcB family protein [Clostridium fermenticellae]|uniref:Fluoride-specific ion channel FluC n=1 Tax=Clostridium fermenticellae TaxID=2068654 RepID=A0A386H436_9CLOT|nr:CrcB family protein [Clostridium fermenticellae]AYD40501.1 CrcB family protein [Clostridium fermenticellae]
MRKYIFIGLGGFFGAILRSFIKNTNILNHNTLIPFDTLFINISGSFMLAFILTTVIKYLKIDENIQLGISTGFVGTYTTFSTLCKEMVALITNKFYYAAISYVIISLLIGFTAVYLGIFAANKFNSAMKKFQNKSDNEKNIQDIDDII